jgi:hypothetical protein
MAIRTFKEIIDNKGYRIEARDREIFEQGNLQSFFGLGDQDAIEFIMYDTNDNQLPQKNGNLVTYVTLSTQNIKDYILLPEGTIFQRYQFPKEYFVDIERLIKEAGYDSGIFKTQITLINKRVGSEQKYNKLWINEISPSRTEIRLVPLKKGLETNPELRERFNLMIRDGNFRDDTIYFVFKFIENITPTKISSYMRDRYSEKFLVRLKTEFKIQDFETFVSRVYDTFVESSAYEFTNRISELNNVNYGKPKNSRPSIELTKSTIVSICQRLLIASLDYHLLRPDVKTTTTFDAGNDASYDEVGKVLQRLNSDTRIDTRSPIIELVKQSPPVLTPVQEKIRIVIRKETPIDKTLPISTPVDFPVVEPEPPRQEPEVIVMRKYMVSNLARQRDGAGQMVVVRYQNEFKDGKQIQLQGGDSIDICALQNSINIEDPDVRMMVKDVGPCDKAYERVSPAIPTDEPRGGAAAGSGGGGTTGGVIGRNDRFETGNTTFFEDPSVQNMI